MLINLRLLFLLGSRGGSHRFGYVSNGVFEASFLFLCQQSPVQSLSIPVLVKRMRGMVQHIDGVSTVQLAFNDHDTFEILLFDCFFLSSCQFFRVC